jgi:hypothetical protein
LRHRGGVEEPAVTVTEVVEYSPDEVVEFCSGHGRIGCQRVGFLLDPIPVDRFG